MSQDFLSGKIPGVIVDHDIRVYQLVGEHWELVDADQAR